MHKCNAQSLLYPKTLIFYVSFSVISVFGSVPASVDASLGSVCSGLHIPYLSTAAAPGQEGDPQEAAFVFRLGPQERHLAAAVADMAREMKWTHAAFIAHKQSG